MRLESRRAARTGRVAYTVPAMLRATTADEMLENGQYYMRTKSQAAWEAAARFAALAQETDEPLEREHYTRLRDAWITLAKRCESFILPDVTDSNE